MPEPGPATPAATVGDDAAMASLRVSALALADGTDWSRCDDHEVAGQVASALVRGRLSAAQAAPALALYRLAVAPVAAAPSAPLSAAPPSVARGLPAAGIALPDATLSLDLDVQAMVQALIEAANNGVPFCEECERARRAAQGAA